MNKIILTICLVFSFGIYSDEPLNRGTTDGAFTTLMLAAPDIDKYVDTLKTNTSAFSATGATDAGVCGEGPPQVTGRGGAGAPNTISGSDVAYAGGAGGMCGGKSPCGSGGGYAPSPAGGPQLSGSTNTGGGGTGGNPSVGSGGSGIVIIRYLYQ